MLPRETPFIMRHQYAGQPPRFDAREFGLDASE